MENSFDILYNKANEIKKFSVSKSKPLYYFTWYEAAGGIPESGLNESQKLILGFKYPNKTYHKESQDKALELMYKFLSNNFGEKNDYVIIPIPASKIEENKLRFGNFLRILSDKLGIENGFDYVKPFQNRPEKHSGNREINFANYVIFDNTLKGKNIIIFDDLVTDGKNMNEMRNFLEGMGGKPFLCLSLGRTLKHIPGSSITKCLIGNDKNPYIKAEEPKIEPNSYDAIKKIRDEDNDRKSLMNYLIERTSNIKQSWKDKYLDKYTLELIAKKKPITTSEFEEIEEFQSPSLFNEMNFLVKYIKQYYEKKLNN